MAARPAALAALLATLAAPAAALGFAPGTKVEVFGTGTADDGRRGEVAFELTKSARDVVAFDGSPEVKSVARASLRLPVVAKPSVPTGLTATAGDAKVDLTWTANPASEQVDAYQVYRDGALVKDGVAGTSYSATGLANGTSYSFRVSAHNAAGYGDWSAAVSAAPQAPAPAPSTRPAITFTRVNQFAGGTGFTASAGRNEFIVLQGFWRKAEILEVNAANPGAQLLVYKNLTRYKAPGADGGYNSCVTSAEAASNPYGFNWTSTVADADSGGNIVKPLAGSGDEYGRWCVDRLLKQLADSRFAGYPVDGIFLDDVNSYGTPDCGCGYPDANLNGASWEAADAVAWNAWAEAVNAEVGDGLKAQGFWAMANLDAAMGQRNLQSGGWDERQIPAYDAVYVEFTSAWGGGAAQDQSFVNETFRLLGVGQATQTVMVAGEGAGLSESVNAFSLGMCLVKTGGYCSKMSGVGNTEQWFQSYDRARALGQPTGPAVNQGSGVWTRPFGAKTVTVNLTARTATIP